MTKPKSFKNYRWPLLIASLILAFLAFVFYPLPYYVEMPGGAQDIAQVLTVDGKEAEETGSYNFTAVSVGQVTGIQWLYAMLTPFTEIVPAAQVTGGASDEDFIRINQFYMETSQNEAIYQALKLADEEVSLDFLGVYVLNVAENSTFQGVLNLADTVTGVNGKTFSSSKELIAYVSSLTLGDKVTVQFTSNGQEQSEEGKIIKLDNGKNGIGIGLVDHTTVASDHDISFAIQGVGGPSAGLMFTLAIYDQLVAEDVTKGRIIAGTGTINNDGTVGDIGGAGLKVVAADAIGAEIFFVPNNPLDPEVLKENPDAQTNYEEALAAAKELGTDMVIVPVTSAQEALDYLKAN